MPAYVPQPSYGGRGDGGAPFVPDRGFNLDLPLMDEPDVEPDPVEESVAESFPVPDSGPIYTEELPPLEPVAEPFPVPDQPPLEFFDLPPLFNEQPAPALQPSVGLIQDLPVSAGPAPPSNPEDDFEVDREAGLVPEWDVYMPPPEQLPPEPAPKPTPPAPETPLEPVAESFPVSDQPPLEFFDLPPLPDEQTAPPPQPSPSSDDFVGPIEPVDEFIHVPDYTDDLWGPDETTLSDLSEMALFDLMAQELLTGGGGGWSWDDFNLVREH